MDPIYALEFHFFQIHFKSSFQLHLNVPGRLPPSFSFSDRNIVVVSYFMLPVCSACCVLLDTLTLCLLYTTNRNLFSTQNLIDRHTVVSIHEDSELSFDPRVDYSYRVSLSLFSPWRWRPGYHLQTSYLSSPPRFVQFISIVHRLIQHLRTLFYYQRYQD
jgi:hypothetical protein